MFHQIFTQRPPRPVETICYSVEHLKHFLQRTVDRKADDNSRLMAQSKISWLFRLREVMRIWLQ